METKVKYWVACGYCGAPQMQVSDESAPANALECELCGNLQSKPINAREVARFLSEAVPDDKDPVIIMQRLTDAAKAFFTAGGSFVGFAQCEGVAGVFHGGMHNEVVDVATRAMQKDDQILRVMRQAILAVDHQLTKIVPERDTYNPAHLSCKECGGETYNRECLVCGKYQL